MIKSLTHPIDVETILRKKKGIRRQLLNMNCDTELSIAILGGSTTSEIKNILELFLLNNNIKPTFYESEFNKFYEDSIFGNDKLEVFNPDIIYIHTTNVNIEGLPKIGDSIENIEYNKEKEIKKYNSIWRSLTRFECPIIQNNFDLPHYRKMGNIEAYDIHGHVNFIQELNSKFAVCARDYKNLFLNDINYLSSYLGIRHWFDKNLWYTSKYALSFNAIPHLAKNLTNLIMAIVGKTKKCLVLDLDNTCWGGVIGDDGLSGIEIGNETAISEAYTDFQKYVKDLKERGVILAVNSKNDFENAKEGFTHPDSILSYEDFSSFYSNWETKDENIIKIAKEINIGIDSLVFIDDNPVERDIVSSQVPQVEVPDIGQNIIDYIDFIDQNGYFEMTSLSNDDLNRSKYYEDNKKRTVSESEFKNYDDFLKSLNMTAEISSFQPIYLDRITQLINKTNQFNLTTKRYTRPEVEEIYSNPNYIKLYGRLEDKYGDNGLVSILIGKVNGQECEIDLWLMSCRVLKRDMEFAMLDSLVEVCKQNGINKVIGNYYKSPKNKMVKDLFHNFGFELIEENGENSKWKMDVMSHQQKNKFITINK